MNFCLSLSFWYLTSVIVTSKFVLPQLQDRGFNTRNLVAAVPHTDTLQLQKPGLQIHKQDPVVVLSKNLPILAEYLPDNATVGCPGCAKRIWVRKVV